MCHFYSAYLSEITGAAKGVFTHSQSSCHIAKVVLALTAAKSPQRLTRHLATPPAVSSLGGLRTPAPVRAAPPSWGRHPKTFTDSEAPDFCDSIDCSPLAKAAQEPALPLFSSGADTTAKPTRSGQLPKSPPEVKSIDCTKTAGDGFARRMIRWSPSVQIFRRYWTAFLIRRRTISGSQRFWFRLVSIRTTSPTTH